MPVAGPIVAALLYYIYGPLFGLIAGLMGLGLLSAFGVLLALVSLLRRERWIAFSLAALALNSLPVIWWAVHWNDKVNVLGP
jgi:hypothetical protein